MNNIKNKTVLITGGTSGIGYELTKLFAEKGYDLIHIARDGAKMKEIGDDLIMAHNIKVTNIVKDLSSPGAPKETYDEIKSQGLVVDVLVNNVGSGVFGEFVNTDLDEELASIRLNIDSFVVFTKLFLKEMVERNEGKILQLASMVSKVPAPMQAVYAGTKAFIYNFSQSLVSELKDTNVTITALRPGATDTDFFREAGAEDIKIHEPENLSDPAQVAKDGYEALMMGEPYVVSGLKNKIQDKLSNILPDSVVAEQMAKQNERVNK